MSLFKELKRRNVFRVAIAYMAGSWLLIEVTETLFPIYGLSDAAIRMVVTLVAIVFPVVLVVSWVFELTPEGLRLEKMWRWPPCQRRARLPGRAGFGPGFL